jgi:segregation and condensation protein B
MSSSIVKTLLEREWIRVVGYREVPGRPALYATTKEFLDYFGLKSLDGLPTLAELKDLEAQAAELQVQIQLDTISSSESSAPVADITPEEHSLPIEQPLENSL